MLSRMMWIARQKSRILGHPQ